MSLKLKDRYLSKKRSFKHKKWFDYTLKEPRASLIVCSSQLAYKPFDREFRQKCFRLHSKYLKTKRAKRRNFYSIMKTCPCKIYPLIPHVYIAKLGFAGVYLFFLFLLQK